MKNNFIKDFKKAYLNGGSTVKLIVWNSIMFLFIQILFILSRILKSDELNKLIFDIFSLNTDLNIFIYHPWGILTSFFSHISFFHWIFNMLMLYFAGQLFEKYFSPKKMLILYFVGGIVGGIFEIIAHLLLPNMTPVTSVLGASGAIMSIFIGLAFYQPNLSINLFGILNLKIIYLALFYLFYELLSIGIQDGTAHFAHIGGAFIGWLATKNAFSPTNLLNVISVFFDSLKRSKSKKNKISVKKMSDEEFNLHKKNKQEKTDIILDKISKHGYDSLTKAEKEFLFSQSK